MDLLALQPSLIVKVAREALSHPGTEFLCFGESDQRFPDGAAHAVADALTRGDAFYSDVRGIPALRQALADMLTRVHAKPVAEGRVQVTSSGMTAINVALAAIVRAGERVVQHGPAWPNVANAVRLRGATPEVLALDEREGGGFSLDLDRLDAMLAGARALVINSPSNPTGWTATRDELAAILDLCRRHAVWLISDEVYTHLVYDDTNAAASLLDIAEPGDRVIVCNSFSKAWAMTGWRLGWMVVPEGARDTIAEIVEVTHSGSPAFCQAGALAALEDREFIGRFRAHCAEGRAIVSDALAGLNGIRYAPPPGAFYAFFGVEGMPDSVDFALRLVREHGVAVAPGRAFGAEGEGHLRLCFAQSRPKLERAIDRLRNGLQNR